MTSISDVIETFFVVLEDERQAIRRVDAAKIAEAAANKEALGELLRSATPADLAPFADRLALLRAGLRRNGILLAHARAVVSDALEVLAPRRGPSSRGVLRARM